MMKALLQLRNVAWYPVNAANLSPTQSSVRSRRAEKYPGIPAGSAASTSQKADSNAALLEYWWLTGSPRYSRVGTDADHSFDITTTSRSSRTAARTAMAEMTPVTGTCPLRNPSSADRSSCGSISRPARTTGSLLTSAGRSMAANRSPGLLTTNSATSAATLRTPSTVTMESMPPPNGTSARPSRAGAGVGAGAGGCAGAPGTLDASDAPA